MALEEYAQKRNFSSTPEPSASQAHSPGDALRFVVQKHRATRLHYDLRLELDGVMKSWAVPKGPSMDPAEKKLAMMVEDHPFDYRNFEGVIPEGNYGAGPVMIWDEGDYTVPGAEGRTNAEQAMKEALQKGNLLFTMHGQRLRGSFHLVKMHGRDENAWLLIKKHDEHAGKEDILSQDTSVRTGRSMDEIANEGKQAAGKQFQLDIPSLDLSGAPRIRFPGPLKPMLAQLIKEPFDRHGWLFEIKWDGYRAIAETHRESVRLYSRNMISFTADYPAIVKDLERFGFEAILDGEIVVVDEKGRADFGLIQKYRSTGQGNLVYYVFDLIYLDGYDLRPFPLYRRKELLKKILPALPHIKYSDHVEEQGTALYRLAKELNVEGIMAKDANSAYLPGVRSQHWQKIKTYMRQEAVIGGFTEPRGGRTGLGAVLVGFYEGNKLVYAGHVGGGFKDEELPQVRDRLARLSRPSSPFSNTPRAHTDVTWIEPKLVCEIRFAEWTTEGIMRQPIFMGFRDDLDPKQVRREMPVTEPARTLHFAPPQDQGQRIVIDNRTLVLTNLNKLYWPADNITKGDMIDYYRQVSPFLLPHLKDRPESLHRFPNGIEEESFFQKNIEGAPDWASTVRIESDTDEGVTEYLLCQDEAALVYIVNLGSLEINPWLSRVGNLDNPDCMVIDLDPLDIGFEEVITTAQVAHELLEQIKLPNYIKTSGATGLHIFTPFAARYTYEQVRQLATLVCAIINRRLPAFTSLERVPERRKGKVYLDYLQNTKGKTMAAPYSLRPLRGAPVSTPLQWEEVRRELTPGQFTIRNILQRLETYGDLWAPVNGPGVSMQESLDLLKGLF